jgi:hypothetical protein
MSYFTTSEINLYFTHNSAKRTLTLKDINDFNHFWHCVKQPYCILTLSNSWHKRFSFVLYLWEGRNKRYKATKNRKILMMTVLLGMLFEYTRWPIFVSVSVHVITMYPMLREVNFISTLLLNIGKSSHFLTVQNDTIYWLPPPNELINYTLYTFLGSHLNLIYFHGTCW